MGIGELITAVQGTFAKVFNTQWFVCLFALSTWRFTFVTFRSTDGTQFDKLFKKDEKFKIGEHVHARKRDSKEFFFMALSRFFVVSESNPQYLAFVIPTHLPFLANLLSSTILLFTSKTPFLAFEGNLDVVAMHAPGHTPDHLAYYISGDCIFTGDSLFMPDQGTARCDFPAGSAEDLWNSMQKILSLPPSTRVFVGHDYGPGATGCKL